VTDKRLLTVVQSTTNSQGAQIVDHHVGRRHIGFYKGLAGGVGDLVQLDLHPLHKPCTSQEKLLKGSVPATKAHQGWRQRGHLPACPHPTNPIHSGF